MMIGSLLNQVQQFDNISVTSLIIGGSQTIFEDAYRQLLYQSEVNGSSLAFYYCLYLSANDFIIGQ